jgi:hypothetical protein
MLPIYTIAGAIIFIALVFLLDIRDMGSIKLSFSVEEVQMWYLVELLATTTHE